MQDHTVMAKNKLRSVLFNKQLIYTYNRQQGGLDTVYHILNIIDVYYISKQTELKYEVHHSSTLILSFK